MLLKSRVLFSEHDDDELSVAAERGAADQKEAFPSAREDASRFLGCFVLLFMVHSQRNSFTIAAQDHQKKQKKEQLCVLGESSAVEEIALPSLSCCWWVIIIWVPSKKK